MRWGLVIIGVLISSTLFAMPFSWNQVEGLPEDIVAIESDYVQGRVFLAVTGSGTLYRSIDSGDSWNQITTPDSKAVKILKRDPSQVTAWYCVTEFSGNQEFWRSPDNCSSWTFRTNFTESVSSLSASPLASGLLLAVFDAGGQLSLRKSEDSGGTWHHVLGDNTSALDPFWHSTSLWQAYWGQNVSNDFGESWSSTSAKPLSGCSTKIPPALLAATSEGLFQSTDNLVTWWPLLTDPVDFVALNPKNGNQILAGSTSDQMVFSQDGGSSFGSWSRGLPAGSKPTVSLVSDWMFFCIVNGVAYRYDERPADLDNTNRIDGGDLIIMSTAFGTFSGDSGYVESADLNHDGAIDGNDLVILSSVFGHRFYYDDPEGPGDFPGNEN